MFTGGVFQHAMDRVCVFQHAMDRVCVSQHAMHRVCVSQHAMGRGCLPLGPGWCLPLGLGMSASRSRGVYIPLARYPWTHSHPWADTPWTHTPPVEMNIEVGSMHPNGMHSYLYSVSTSLIHIDMQTLSPDRYCSLLCIYADSTLKPMYLLFKNQ